jgi:hypothetical protein
MKKADAAISDGQNDAAGANQNSAASDAAELITFGRYKGATEQELLKDAEYCDQLLNAPGIRVLVFRACEAAVVAARIEMARTSPADIDAALDALEGAGVVLRAVPFAEALRVELAQGQTQMIDALHRRRFRQS